MAIRVLVLCTGNSARSQIAEAWFRHLGSGVVEVESAGSQPAGLHPLTPQVMSEVGVATDGQASKSLTRFLDLEFDYVITVCDNAAQNCPVFPGSGERLHWGLPDPAGADDELSAFRSVRDDLRGRVSEWLEQLA